VTSPYLNEPVADWPKITKKLLAHHPLTTNVILDVATQAWGCLWNTRVGVGKTAVEFNQLEVPATVVGYFFEVLFANELERRFPGIWRRCKKGDDKDLVYAPDPRLSVEIKTSGQLGLKVYGNRSYGQKVQNQLLLKKEKSGFYITINFYKQTLMLVRFGWIDADDWKPQASPTGQMAGLPGDVYQLKLIPIAGNYRLLAPVEIVPGIGSKTAVELASLGIETVGDLLLSTAALPPRILRIRDEIKASYSQEQSS
jgi:hypothetical protein